jgi:DNA-nicking Smr family endonuclease
VARKGRRGLTAEDRALWSKVVENATPMHKRRPPAPLQAPAPDKPTRIHDARRPLPEFRVGEKAPIPAGSGRALAAHGPASPRMDARAFTRMKRGKLAPEARIDLHGMTAAAAHSALAAFILRAAAEGRRLVLVITGKGREADGPIPEQRGILRRQVPHWLETPPLSQVVLQVESAHRRHGGSGAYYVYLRRRQ